MKIASLFSLFSAVALASALAASAEQAGKATFVIAGGFGFPTAPTEFSEYWKMGFGGGVGADISAGRAVSYTFDLDFSNFPFNEDRFLAKDGPSPPGKAVEREGGSRTTMLGLMGVKFHMPEAAVARPYLLLAAGLGHISTADATDSDGVYLQGSRKNKAALAAGGGVHVHPGGSGLGYVVSVRWVWLKRINTGGETTSIVPIRLGVTF